MTIRLLPLFLLGTLLQADALGDLRDALVRLDSQSPVKASIEYQFWSRQGDDRQPVVSEGRAAATVEDGPQGLRMTWAPDLLKAAAREAQVQAADPEAKASTRQALEGLRALAARDALHGAETLLRHLEQAQLVEAREDTWQGRPARLLRLKITPRLSRQDRKYVKEAEASLQVWTGADGVPLAAETRVHFKGRAFLVISFEQQERETFQFAHSGGRLVVVLHTKESSGSGGGEHGQRKTVVTLHLA